MGEGELEEVLARPERRSVPFARLLALGVPGAVEGQPLLVDAGRAHLHAEGAHAARARRWLRLGWKVSVGRRSETHRLHAWHAGRKYSGPKRRHPRTSIRSYSSGVTSCITSCSSEESWSGR